MRRREFVTLMAGVAAAIASPRTARAQQPRRIDVLMGLTADQLVLETAAFEQVLRSLGWRLGHDVQIDYRWRGEGDRLHAEAAALVASAPDLIVANSTSSLAALKE